MSDPGADDRSEESEERADPDADDGDREDSASPADSPTDGTADTDERDGEAADEAEDEVADADETESADEAEDAEEETSEATLDDVTGGDGEDAEGATDDADQDTEVVVDADADDGDEEQDADAEEDEETAADYQSDEVLGPEAASEAAPTVDEVAERETADDEDDAADEDDAEDEDVPEWASNHDDEEPSYKETLSPRVVGTPEPEDEEETGATALERKTGPPSDREQPLAEHIEEMIKRLAIVVAIAGVVSLAAFPFAENAITFLWYSVLPEGISQPHVYHPLELLLTQLKTASLLGLIIALPVFVYETYAFMRPGLYPHERRYYLAAVPTSLVLALLGVTFAYFIVLPAVMGYFLYYSKDVVDIAFALGQTFNLILILMGYLALVFQIPLFVMLAIMMGLVTREWLEDKRIIFWGVFLGLSFLFSPDPTGMAPLIVAATMVALFEGTLLLLRWTNRGGEAA